MLLLRDGRGKDLLVVAHEVNKEHWIDELNQSRPDEDSLTCRMAILY